MTKKPITKCASKGRLRSKCDLADHCWVANCGYSKLLKPNPHWKEQHGICRWEHCIEWQPIGCTQTAKSCPIFGHDCPGGSVSASACRRQRDASFKKGRPSSKRSSKPSVVICKQPSCCRLARKK